MQNQQVGWAKTERGCCCIFTTERLIVDMWNIAVSKLRLPKDVFHSNLNNKKESSELEIEQTNTAISPDFAKTSELKLMGSTSPSLFCQTDVLAGGKDRHSPLQHKTKPNGCFLLLEMFNHLNLGNLLIYIRSFLVGIVVYHLRGPAGTKELLVLDVCPQKTEMSASPSVCYNMQRHSHQHEYSVLSLSLLNLHILLAVPVSCILFIATTKLTNKGTLTLNHPLQKGNLGRREVSCSDALEWHTWPCSPACLKAAPCSSRHSSVAA